MVTPTSPATDGRLQRSERSREAIVSAMLDLIGEGNLSPTAQQVAERADVGVRTVFRHFSEMDALFVAMNEQISHDVEDLFVTQKQTGSFEARVEGLVDRRLELLKVLAPYLRASIRPRYRSRFLQEVYDRDTRRFRRDLTLWLPELESADDTLVAALDLALSFEAYDRLRTAQRLGLRRTHETIQALVSAIVEPIRPST